MTLYLLGRLHLIDEAEVHRLVEARALSHLHNSWPRSLPRSVDDEIAVAFPYGYITLRGRT
jgi:hypothetical protein